MLKSSQSQLELMSIEHSSLFLDKSFVQFTKLLMWVRKFTTSYNLNGSRITDVTTKKDLGVVGALR